MRSLIAPTENNSVLSWGMLTQGLVWSARTFLECDSGVTGLALADKILSFVTHHLDPSKMRGQAYDGASSMAGKT